MSIGKSLFFCNTRQGDNKTKTVLSMKELFLRQIDEKYVGFSYSCLMGTRVLGLVSC